MANSNLRSKFRWVRKMRSRILNPPTFILLEKSLTRLQISRNKGFSKWLMRWPINTASALACTVDSGNFGTRTSGIISLSSAATDDQLPTSMLGSTAETAGPSAKPDGTTTFMSTGSTAAGTPGITANWLLKKGTYWETLQAYHRIKELIQFITCDVTSGRIPDRIWK